MCGLTLAAVLASASVFLWSASQARAAGSGTMTLSANSGTNADTEAGGQLTIATVSLPDCTVVGELPINMFLFGAKSAPFSASDLTSAANYAVFGAGTSQKAAYTAADSFLPWTNGAGTFKPFADFNSGGVDTDGSTTSYHAVSQMVSAWGAGTYSLVTACVTINTTTTPRSVTVATAPDGSAVAVGALLTLNADGSWALGATTLPPPAADATSTTVSATPVAGGGAALTATVSDTTTKGTNPAGTVQFMADGATTPLNATPASVDASTGKATFTASASQLPVGAHSITAAFTPADSSKFTASTSSAVTVTVSPAAPGGTPSPTESATPNPKDSGEPGGAVADGSTATPGTVAGSRSDSTGPTGSGDPGTTGSNDPSTFLTDSTRWATGTPQGLAALLSAVALAIGAGAVGWSWYWRRRRAAQARG